MKRIIMGILLIVFLPVPVVAETLTAETAAKGIIGSWKLLLFEREGEPIKNYEDKEYIWTFDGEKFTVNSEDLGGEIRGSYRVLRTMFRPLRTTIIVLSKELKPTHLPHGKFVITSIADGKLTLGDWDGKVTYTLKRVSS